MLMKDTGAAKKRAVANGNVAAQQTIVCDDDVVSNFAVVADVCAGHEKILVAHFGHAALGAAAMNCAVLANHVFVSNCDIRFSSRRERKILWRSADNSAVSNEVAHADCNVRINYSVRLDCRSFADHDVLPITAYGPIVTSAAIFAPG